MTAQDEWTWYQHDSGYTVTNEQSGAKRLGYFVCTDEESARIACECLNAQARVARQLAAAVKQAREGLEAVRDNLRCEREQRRGVFCEELEYPEDEWCAVCFANARLAALDAVKEQE